MNNNDILRRIRYIFDLSDTKMMKTFALGNKQVNRAEVSYWLKKEEDPELKTIYDVDLAMFLNGMITERRGKKEGPDPIPEKKLNNNIVFRKLKIALNLKDEDIIEILMLVDMRVSKPELSAFFRNTKHQHYRPCKDQILRNFLKGLEVKYRVEKKTE